jgi:sugar phosphate isomerase/epimerase
LRGFDFAHALRITQELGIANWESYSAHIPPDAALAAGNRSAASAAGVRVGGFGVIPFGGDADANRKFFTFGRALGIDYFSADPAPESFASLDRLVEEYGIAVGIHNHGPGHAYATIASIQKAIEGHHPRIGCCIDTGHFLRAGEDPVRAVEVFGERIYGVHLKDVKAGKDVLLGQGELRLYDFLAALAERKYRYCLALEYEENEKAPQAEIRGCLEAAREVCARLRKTG